MTHATDLDVARAQGDDRTGGPPAALRWRTIEISDADAAAATPTGDVSWLAPTGELAGWGTALRVAADGADARRTAGRRLARQLTAIVADRDGDVDRAGGRPDRGRGDRVGESTGQDAARPGPVAFASLPFDPEARGSVLVVPRTTVRRHGGRAWLTVVRDGPIGASDLTLPPPAPSTPEPGGRVRYAGATAAEIAWIEAVDHAVRRIRAGDLEKVVLARDRVVSSDAPFDLPRLLERLRVRFPTCYTFRVDGLVGASPELLLRRDGAAVSSVVLAGTSRRGATAEEDRRLGARLQTSVKDLAEHRPAVDSVRATLRPLVSRLDVESQPHLLRLANVQHLATRVTGRLRTPVDALSLAMRLHPTAAVGGTPTDRALRMIAELETIDRARYAGPVGWVDASGDGEFAIALRCAQFDGRTARLFAGAGIVADSLPESELEETRLKLRAMQSALGGDT